MSGDYTVVVGIMDLIPLVRVYYLDKRKEFQCVAVTLEKGKHNLEALLDHADAFGKEEASMVKEMISTKGVARVAIEPSKLTVHRHSWCEWEELEPKMKELIEGVLGERGDFIPTM